MDKLENRFKRYLMVTMGTIWDAQSHEDMYSTGIPDLSYGISNVNGWIELKVIKSLPDRKETFVDLSHLRIEQVNWLNKRGKKGGHCFFFVKVMEPLSYYIFHWGDVRELKRGVTREEFKALSIDYWEYGLDALELAEILINN